MEPCGGEYFVDQLIEDSETFPCMRNIELRFDCLPTHLFLYRISEASVSKFMNWQASARIDYVTVCGKPLCGEYTAIDLVAMTRCWQGPDPTLDLDLE